MSLYWTTLSPIATIPSMPPVNVTLSWDLVIIVFFAIVMSYSFIIGRNQSIRVMIAAYISIIATQGIGNVILRLAGSSINNIEILNFTFNVSIISALKIIIFVTFIILLALRSGIHITYTKESGSLMNILYTTIFGFGTAGLIISTILTYVAGNAILDVTMPASGAIAPIAQSSPLMQIMVLNQDIWFSLPAILIIAAGFINNE